MGKTLQMCIPETRKTKENERQSRPRCIESYERPAIQDFVSEQTSGWLCGKGKETERRVLGS
jgi:hypothetical protein